MTIEGSSASRSETKSAVLLDTHPLWLEVVEKVLQPVGIEVVLATTSPSEAMDALEDHQPNLFVVEVVTSTDSPEHGIAWVQQACSIVPGLRPIVLSIEDDPHQIEAAFHAGAVAYVVKTAGPDDLSAAVRQSFDQSIYFSPPVLQTGTDAARGVEELTRRELEILRLVAEGHSNAALARMLWVTEQTVKFHLSNIYRKLDVANRTEASRWAQLNGVLGSVAPVASAVATTV